MTDFAPLGATCCLTAAVATTLSLKRANTAATHLLTAIAAVLALRAFRIPMREDYHDFWLLLSATLTGVAVGAAVASYLKRRNDRADTRV